MDLKNPPTPSLPPLLSFPQLLPVAPQVFIEKRRGEGLGVALVESGWGSLLPTAVIANLLHGGPAERSGALSIGDRITAINGTSLVGLPLAACQAAVRVSAPGWKACEAHSAPPPRGSQALTETEAQRGEAQEHPAGAGAGWNADSLDSATRQQGC